MARARGYADWNPKEDTLTLLAQVNQILDEYREYLPLTARQIFYRMVGAYNYDKTEKAYANLCEKLVRARRAQLIPFSAIRDDKVSEHAAGGGYRDPARFWESLRDRADYYGRPVRQGQDHRIEFWTEAGGMSEMLAGMARPYGVPVFSAGGFLSVTATHQIAQRALASDKPTIMLHVGDYDPSGESIFDAMMGDALQFFAAHRGGGRLVDFEDQFKAVRVALTWEQVEEHGIDTAPPKSTDSRSPRWEDEGRFETAQAEAIDPPLLKTMVETAIEEFTDIDLLNEVIEQSNEERDVIEARLQRIVDEVEAEIESEEEEDA